MSSQFGPRVAGSVVADGVRRTFGDEVVLNHLSLEAAAGSIVSLIGANGSGKSTLMRILVGVLEPDAGVVLVAGERPGLGLASYVPGGERMLNFRLTGEQNLRFYAHVAGVPEADVAGAVRRAAEVSDAGGLLRKRAGECSTGQRRRLMLAVGIVGSPPVLLLDEPYSDLDDRGCATMASAARGWADAGGLVVYAAPRSEHGPLADVVYRFREGAVEVAS